MRKGLKQRSRTASPAQAGVRGGSGGAACGLGQAIASNQTSSRLDGDVAGNPWLGWGPGQDLGVP